MPPSPAWINARDATVTLAIRLQARASRNQIQGPLGNQLRIQVTAPPVDHSANGALLELLAEALNCSRSQIHILHGQHSRQKQVAIRGLSAADVLHRLAHAGRFEV